MKNSNEIKIIHATNEEHFDLVRNLINAFVKWHLNRHVDDIHFTNKYFNPKDLERELASLPDKYSMPTG